MQPTSVLSAGSSRSTVPGHAGSSSLRTRLSSKSGTAGDSHASDPGAVNGSLRVLLRSMAKQDVDNMVCPIIVVYRCTVSGGGERTDDRHRADGPTNESSGVHAADSADSSTPQLPALASELLASHGAATASSSQLSNIAAGAADPLELVCHAIPHSCNTSSNPDSAHAPGHANALSISASMPTTAISSHTQAFVTDMSHTGHPLVSVPPSSMSSAVPSRRVSDPAAVHHVPLSSSLTQNGAGPAVEPPRREQPPLAPPSPSSLARYTAATSTSTAAAAAAAAAPRHVIVYANTAALQMLGSNSVQALAGRTLEESFRCFTVAASPLTSFASLPSSRHSVHSSMSASDSVPGRGTAAASAGPHPTTHDNGQELSVTASSDGDLERSRPGECGEAMQAPSAPASMVHLAQFPSVSPPLHQVAGSSGPVLREVSDVEQLFAHDTDSYLTLYSTMDGANYTCFSVSQPTVGMPANALAQAGVPTAVEKEVRAGSPAKDGAGGPELSVTMPQVCLSSGRRPLSLQPTPTSASLSTSPTSTKLAPPGGSTSVLSSTAAPLPLAARSVRSLPTTPQSHTMKAEDTQAPTSPQAVAASQAIEQAVEPPTTHVPFLMIFFLHRTPAEAAGPESGAPTALQRPANGPRASEVDDVVPFVSHRHSLAAEPSRQLAPGRAARRSSGGVRRKPASAPPAIAAYAGGNNNSSSADAAAAVEESARRAEGGRGEVPVSLSPQSLGSGVAVDRRPSDAVGDGTGSHGRVLRRSISLPSLSAAAPTTDEEFGRWLSHGSFQSGGSPSLVQVSQRWQYRWPGACTPTSPGALTLSPPERYGIWAAVGKAVDEGNALGLAMHDGSDATYDASASALAAAARGAAGAGSHGQSGQSSFMLTPAAMPMPTMHDPELTSSSQSASRLRNGSSGEVGHGALSFSTSAAADERRQAAAADDRRDDIAPFSISFTPFNAGLAQPSIHEGAAEGGGAHSPGPALQSMESGAASAVSGRVNGDRLSISSRLQSHALRPQRPSSPQMFSNDNSRGAPFWQAQPAAMQGSMPRSYSYSAFLSNGGVVAGADATPSQQHWQRQNPSPLRTAQAPGVSFSVARDPLASETTNVAARGGSSTGPAGGGAPVVGGSLYSLGGFAPQRAHVVDRVVSARFKKQLLYLHGVHSITLSAKVPASFFFNQVSMMAMLQQAIKHMRALQVPGADRLSCFVSVRGTYLVVDLLPEVLLGGASLETSMSAIQFKHAAEGKELASQQKMDDVAASELHASTDTHHNGAGQFDEAKAAAGRQLRLIDHAIGASTAPSLTPSQLPPSLSTQQQQQQQQYTRHDTLLVPKVPSPNAPALMVDLATDSMGGSGSAQRQQRGSALSSSRESFAAGPSAALAPSILTSGVSGSAVVAPGPSTPSPQVTDDGSSRSTLSVPNQRPFVGNNSRSSSAAAAAAADGNSSKSSLGVSAATRRVETAVGRLFLHGVIEPLESFLSPQLIDLLVACDGQVSLRVEYASGGDTEHPVPGVVTRAADAPAPVAAAAQVAFPFITKARLDLLEDVDTVQLSRQKGLSMFGISTANALTEDAAKAANAPSPAIIPLQYDRAAKRFSKDAMGKSVAVQPLSSSSSPGAATAASSAASFADDGGNGAVGGAARVYGAAASIPSRRHSRDATLAPVEATVATATAVASSSSSSAVDLICWKAPEGSSSTASSHSKKPMKASRVVAVTILPEVHTPAQGDGDAPRAVPAASMSTSECLAPPPSEDLDFPNRGKFLEGKRLLVYRSSRDSAGLTASEECAVSATTPEGGAAKAKPSAGLYLQGSAAGATAVGTAASCPDSTIAARAPGREDDREASVRAAAQSAPTAPLPSAAGVAEGGRKPAPLHGGRGLASAAAGDGAAAALLPTVLSSAPPSVAAGARGRPTGGLPVATAVKHAARESRGSSSSNSSHVMDSSISGGHPNSCQGTAAAAALFCSSRSSTTITTGGAAPRADNLAHGSKGNGGSTTTSVLTTRVQALFAGYQLPDSATAALQQFSTALDGSTAAQNPPPPTRAVSANDEVDNAGSEFGGGPRKSGAAASTKRSAPLHRSSEATSSQSSKSTTVMSRLTTSSTGNAGVMATSVSNKSFSAASRGKWRADSFVGANDSFADSRANLFGFSGVNAFANFHFTMDNESEEDEDAAHANGTHVSSTLDSSSGNGAQLLPRPKSRNPTGAATTQSSGHNTSGSGSGSAPSNNFALPPNNNASVTGSNSGSAAGPAPPARKHLNILLYSARERPDVELAFGHFGHCLTCVTTPWKMQLHLNAGLKGVDILMVEWRHNLITPEIRRMLMDRAMAETAILYHVTPNAEGKLPMDDPFVCSLVQEVVDEDMILCSRDVATAFVDPQDMTQARDYVQKAVLRRELLSVRARHTFQIVRQIGSGAFGDVFEVVMYASKGRLAMKRVFLKSVSLRTLETLNREVYIMSSLDHPNIITFSHTRLDDTAFSIFMELCDGTLSELIAAPQSAEHWAQRDFTTLAENYPQTYSSPAAADLLDHLGRVASNNASRADNTADEAGDGGGNSAMQASPLLPPTGPLHMDPGYRHYLCAARATLIAPQEAVLIIHDVASAISCLHSKGIIHRDIKPENILFSSGVAKLADFGSAVKVNERRPLTNMKGTLSYMSPEVLLGEPYGKPCDMWSFGCVIADIMGLSLGHLSGLHVPALINLYKSIGHDESIPITLTNHSSSNFENHHSIATTQGVLDAVKAASVVAVRERSMAATNSQWTFSHAGSPPAQPSSSGASATTQSASAPVDLSVASRAATVENATALGSPSRASEGGAARDRSPDLRPTTLTKPESPFALLHRQQSISVGPVPAMHGAVVEVRPPNVVGAGSLEDPTRPEAGRGRAASRTPDAAATGNLFNGTLASTNSNAAYGGATLSGARAVTCINTGSFSAVSTQTAVLPRSLIELFEGLFHRNPKRRMTVEEVLDHPVSWDMEWMATMMDALQAVERSMFLDEPGGTNDRADGAGGARANGQRDQDCMSLSLSSAPDSAASASLPAATAHKAAAAVTVEESGADGATVEAEEDGAAAAIACEQYAAASESPMPPANTAVPAVEHVKTMQLLPSAVSAANADAETAQQRSSAASPTQRTVASVFSGTAADAVARSLDLSLESLTGE